MILFKKYALAIISVIIVLNTFNIKYIINFHTRTSIVLK